MRAVFVTGGIRALQKVRRCKGVKNRLDLNKKPIILAADFATEEMCSFQDRSDRLSHIFRAFEMVIFQKKNNSAIVGKIFFNLIVQLKIVNIDIITLGLKMNIFDKGGFETQMFLKMYTSNFSRELVSNYFIQKLMFLFVV